MPTTSECARIERQLQNCLVAVMRWKKVRPQQVNLDDWRCGTHACFGGHLATWPEFQAQGVEQSTYGGEPVLPAGTSSKHYTVYGCDVAHELFGDGDLFSSRGGHSVDFYAPKDESDHRLVLRRLEYRITRLAEQL